MKILLDADIFIAIHNPSDALHVRVVSVFKQLNSRFETHFYTTWDIIDEVATKLSYFITKSEAKKFLASLNENTISILYLDYEASKNSEKLFSSIASKRVSMTDCSNMVLFKKYQLDYLFSYDKIYQQQQIPLLTDFLKR